LWKLAWICIFVWIYMWLNCFDIFSTRRFIILPCLCSAVIVRPFAPCNKYSTMLSALINRTRSIRDYSFNHSGIHGVLWI
jgi:hypothetical protein